MSTKELEAWLVGRPQIIKDIARKYPFGKIYTYKGHSKTSTYKIYAIHEDGTITCRTIATSGPPTMVFNMNPEDLILVEEEKK